MRIFTYSISSCVQWGFGLFNRLILLLGCLVLLSGCSLVDRQGAPELLDLKTDRGGEPSVGRGQLVKITVFADDPDNDELDFRWTASGGDRARRC